MTLSTCLTGMTKNSSFLHFRAIFMSYCPLFWGCGGDLHSPWHSVNVWEAWPKAFMAVFVSYCPLFWGSGGFTLGFRV
jgi:hypothetical protein